MASCIEQIACRYCALRFSQMLPFDVSHRSCLVRGDTLELREVVLLLRAPLSQPTPEIIAHHTNHKNMSRTPIRDHSSKTPGSETTETRNPHPTPSQFIISNHRNHSSKNNIPSIHVNSQLAAKLPLERQNSGKTPLNLPEIAARAAS